MFYPKPKYSHRGVFLLCLYYKDNLYWWIRKYKETDMKAKFRKLDMELLDAYADALRTNGKAN